MANQFLEKYDPSNHYYSITKRVSVPKHVLTYNRIIASMEPGIEVDAYRILRTKVLREMMKNHWLSLAITSPTPGAGKSLTSINLSLSIARQFGTTVLLVDADLRRPCIHRYFNFHEFLPGLSDHLTRNIPLELLFIYPQLGTFIILPGGKKLVNSSEMLGSPKMHDLVFEMKNRYLNRITVFDMPPLLVADDAIALTQNIDAVLLVIEDGVTTKQELTAAIELLDGTNIIGTVLNKSKQKPNVNGYYHH